MTLAHAWSALRHGGNLLSPAALDGLLRRDRPPGHLADKLRGAIVDLPPASQDGGRVAGDTLSALLDVVLDSLCGLPAGWRKGSQVTASDAQKLLDGTVLKPRRIFDAPDFDRVAVFTTPVARIGVGAGRRPVAQVIEYLRRSGVPFGLLTNGREWRLVWADADALAWVEWDAERWLNAEVLSDELGVLITVLSAPALSRPRGASGVVAGGLSPLLTAIRDTRRGQAKLSKELGERVRQAVETLLRARAPVVSPVWGQHVAADLYVAACHIVMRLVVVLFAEARELLPVDSPVYHQAYSVRGLFDQLSNMPSERRRRRQAAWPRLIALFRLLHQGSLHPSVMVEAYGGALFKAGDPSGDGVQRALALLEAMTDSPDDDAVFYMLERISRTMVRLPNGAAGGVRLVPAPVDFTELTSEYIGILYEGLLDYELRRAGAEPIVFLALGDQPALPLDRLEGMDDKALAALVEKAKVKKAAKEEDGEEGEDEEGGEDDDEPEADEPAGADEPEMAADNPIPEYVADDMRTVARNRAEAWGRRAALIGKLVKPPRGRAGSHDPAYIRQLDSAARQLIADVKLPGELFLVRWGGTRKGAGTFYTRPQLTMPTVRRTLEPLLYAGEGEARTVRTPEEILALKVCDPAMGSGSFLVAALRTLTAAVIESLHVHGRITTVNGATTIQCDAFPAEDRKVSVGSVPGAADDRLEAMVRRAVVEHCLYGVDLDPLAVELGRVALWVETLDKRLPFTFLDHKLRCGNALIGTWLDRFRDYPLLAFDRESPDKKWKGVHHVADTWHDALKAKRSGVIAEQAELLSSQVRLMPGTSDEELKTAVARVRRLYRELRDVSAGKPEERARIWLKRIQPDEALAVVRAAFDTWCALWFWPLDRIAEAPGPRELHAPSEAAKGVAQGVRERLRFFHWELEFPDVFTEEGAGFDAVVGNPPWETLQPEPKEFFSNHDPLYRAYSKQQGLAVQRGLFANSEVEQGWLDYAGAFKNTANFLRFAAEPFGDGKVAGHGGGDISLANGANGADLHRKWRGRRGKFTGTSDPTHPFVLQGEGKAYTYKMFVELGAALLRPGGQLGVIVPGGLYADKGTTVLRRFLLEKCAWRWLYGYENKDQIFNIHRSFKFCICVAEKGGAPVPIKSAFMRHELDDWAEGAGVLDYEVQRVAAFSPESLSVLEIRSRRDLDVLAKLYSTGLLLGDESARGWGIKYAQGDFNMSTDSESFTQRERAEAEGFKADIYGRWINDLGDLLLPLYEGRMVGQFDFSQKGWVSGKGRGAVWRDLTWDRKRFEPQFLVRRPSADWRPRVGQMRVGAATNTRTLIAALVDQAGCGDIVATLSVEDLSTTLALVAVLNSFSFDLVMRTRVGGIHIDQHHLTPNPLPARAGVPAQLVLSAARLSMASVAFATSWAGPSFQKARRHPWRRLWALTPHERLRLRCMLDAIVAVLYGLDRDDFAWILRDCDHPAARLSEKGFCRTLDPKGFWRVDKASDPELRHTVLSLAAFDDLQAAIGLAGARDAGIQAFCDQNDGDGWMLPESLCLAELGLTRSVDVGVYDERAMVAQPVRARMGERFLDWQLAQTVEESWAECEGHARAILEGGAGPAPPKTPPTSPTASPTSAQQTLFLPRKS
jgi:hypothetical protein